MELSVAISLIENGVDKKQMQQTWMDLGAGTGLFTKALTFLLDEKSVVYAIDKDVKSLKSISNELNAVTIRKIESDFSKDEINHGPFDGILMANSLHFIEGQSHLLSKLSKQLKPDGRIILIEYNMDKSSPWVPYPLNFAALTKLAKSVGFKSITNLGEVPSLYNSATIYSALLR
jgi:ubiquinone/menaquinone biosynthesis C-methylase UbiE